MKYAVSCNYWWITLLALWALFSMTRLYMAKPVSQARNSSHCCYGHWWHWWICESDVQHQISDL